MIRNLGIVVFSSYSGLGNQSRRLTEMLRPERILLIDSSSFSKNAEQHPEWYSAFTGYTSKGFPTDHAVNVFLNGLSHLYIIENPLNWHLISEAKRRGIKTYIASNYEFCDNLKNHLLPIPDFFLMPSYWMIDEMRQKFGENRVKYLPPPTDPNEFKEVREINMNRSGRPRFLHVVGTLAAADRNGTLSLIDSLKYSHADFELVIKSQHELPHEYQNPDRRLSYQIGNTKEAADIYRDFDAMIKPRRFGGLCLPMNESLMAGLPVIMTDISPNNKILPKEWLIPSISAGHIMTRSRIDLYAADPMALGRKLDELAQTDLSIEKLNAFELGYNNFSPSVLQDQYNAIW